MVRYVLLKMYVFPSLASSYEIDVALAKSETAASSSPVDFHWDSILFSLAFCVIVLNTAAIPNASNASPMMRCGAGGLPLALLGKRTGGLQN